jgi:hypothetical protein
VRLVGALSTCDAISGGNDGRSCPARNRIDDVRHRVQPSDHQTIRAPHQVHGAIRNNPMRVVGAETAATRFQSPRFA